MPRKARNAAAGLVYHVYNRGNGRLKLFYKPEDYQAFEQVLGEGLERFPVELYTYCLMPDHWHLVLRPKTDEALGELMRWVGVTHVRRHHGRHSGQGGGHLYQGRYKSFPVQDDRSLLDVCRYVEANGRRAKLAKRAESWQWGGLWRRQHPDQTLSLSPWPVRRPANWPATVNQAMDSQELAKVRVSAVRGRPYGQAGWMAKIVAKLGLEHTLRSPGRPRKNPLAGEKK